jgi:hypothetical protein
MTYKLFVFRTGRCFSTSVPSTLQSLRESVVKEGNKCISPFVYLISPSILFPFGPCSFLYATLLLFNTVLRCLRYVLAITYCGFGTCRQSHTYSNNLIFVLLWLLLEDRQTHISEGDRWPLLQVLVHAR